MSHHPEQNDEKRVPLSIVLITVGIVIILTSIAIWRVLPQQIQTMVAPIPIALPLPTPLPGETAVPTTPTQPSTALLPETPLETTPYPAHFVSALEAAEPNIGQPIRIEIPQIEMDANIAPIGLQPIEIAGETHYQWMVPTEYKAGWHNTSSRIGDGGNIVINGHHNIHGEVFRDIVDLEEGAQIILHDPQNRYVYEVQEVHVLEERDQPLAVRQENAQWINDTADERITLITCWPYSDNSHRVIVVAYPTTANDS